MKLTQIKRTLSTTVGCAIAASALLAAPAFADVGGVPQASINLTGSSLSFCNTAQNHWTISKSANKSSYDSGESVTWTITATKNPDGSPPKVLCAEGTITITNSGQASANVGNIVVNLQKNVNVKGKNRWVSMAADVADATAGDAATSANIVSAASAEDPAANCGPGTPNTCNYVAPAPMGTFTEGAGSGSISFMDVNNNTFFSLVTTPLLGPGQSWTLKYKANFDNDVLQIPGGTQLRTEILVTFGNAGGRGGSGASASGFDINGDTLVNEGSVRTVPVRLTQTVPAFVDCNATVDLTDAMGTTGDASVGTATTNTLPASTSASGSWTIVTPVFGTGTVTNTVDLSGQDNTNGCCEVVDESASATVTVSEDHSNPPPCTTNCPPQNNQFCTYTQGGWGSKPNGNNPGSILAANWNAAFGTGGLVVGTGTTLTFTEAKYISGYTVGTGKNKVNITGFLPQGGTSGVLSTPPGSLINPQSSSAGNFGGQLTALTISLKMSGVGTPGGLGDVMVNTSLGSYSISALVVEMNKVIGGGTSDFSLTELASLAGNLNEAFDNCVANAWALANTTVPQ